VQRESGFARHKLAPARRFKLKLETERITVELHRIVHVGDELDHVSKLCSFHELSSHNRLETILTLGGDVDRHAHCMKLRSCRNWWNLDIMAAA
jgi:hypothetical protein